MERTIEFFKELASLEVDSLCIKDMAGLIRPKIAYDMIKKLKKEINLPIDLHCHCTAGLAPISYYAACEAGVDILDTAISPFGWGTSQPPRESIVAALQGTPYDTGIDLESLVEIASDIKKIREKYAHLIVPLSERVDTRVLVHQIPGGMFSNLISQLKEQNTMEKFEDVLKELPRTRKELGYPPLVTPASQIVGIQAVLNVVLDERYKMVPKEVKDYVRGLYGKTPAPVDEKIKKIIIGDEKPITSRPADLLEPELDKLTERQKKREFYIKKRI